MSTFPQVVRSARLEDAAVVTEIYNHYVSHSVATFDVEPVTAEWWRGEFDARVVRGPFTVLVAEDQAGDVIGYAETAEFRGRPAYSTSITASVYCAPAARGRGVGDALYRELFLRLDASDFHRAYAGIVLPNEASIALHRKHGFVHRGTFTECGFKQGRFQDVAWYERALAPSGSARLEDSGRA